MGTIKNRIYIKVKMEISNDSLWEKDTMELVN
jgi:hypothetical protein